MVFPSAAPVYIPRCMLLQSHTDHYLQACEHDKGYRSQQEYPEESPREWAVRKMSCIYWSEHPDDLQKTA
ncbi:unnamed protein product [Linum tenue]|uniref:Uncharacterized protein n=1 Tax=Linum tenue TaxID=586396 RepID=A0AAV0HT92_9ROSI|nr:unnamed protein product [Linum tenue]